MKSTQLIAYFSLVVFLAISVSCSSSDQGAIDQGAIDQGAIDKAVSATLAAGQPATATPAAKEVTNPTATPAAKEADQPATATPAAKEVDQPATATPAAKEVDQPATATPAAKEVTNPTATPAAKAVTNPTATTVPATPTPASLYLEYNKAWFYELPVKKYEAEQFWDYWVEKEWIATDSSARVLVRKVGDIYEVVTSKDNIKVTLLDEFESGELDENFLAHTCLMIADLNFVTNLNYVVVDSSDYWDSNVINKKISGETCGDGTVAYQSASAQQSEDEKSIDIYFAYTDADGEPVESLPAMDIDITITGSDEEILFTELFEVTPDQQAGWHTVATSEPHAGYVISIDKSKISKSKTGSEGVLKFVTSMLLSSWDEQRTSIYNLPAYSEVEIQEFADVAFMEQAVALSNSKYSIDDWTLTPLYAGCHNWSDTYGTALSGFQIKIHLVNNSNSIKSFSETYNVATEDGTVLDSTYSSPVRELKLLPRAEAETALHFEYAECGEGTHTLFISDWLGEIYIQESFSLP